MQFRTFFLLLLTGLFIFNTFDLIAQKVTTNERGEKIILYPDGSWRYFDETETQNTPPENNSLENSETEYPFEIMNKKPVPNEAENEAIRAAERALAEEALAIEMEEDTRFQRILLEEELEDGQELGTLNKKQINDLQTRIKIAKKREKEASAIRKKASKAANKAEMRVALGMDNDGAKLAMEQNKEASKKEKKQRRKKVKVKKKDHKKRGKQKRTDNNEDWALVTDEIGLEEQKGGGIQDSGKKPNKGPKKTFAVFNPKDDVMLSPPEPACKLTFDGKDDFSGKNRKVVEKQPFFSYTSEKMRPYFKGKEYITCDAYLSSLSGGYKFLTLEITIASDRAQREYGIIEKGSILTVKLLNGTNVKLFNNKTDVGTINSLDKSVSYTAQYIVSSGDEKLLRKNEVDKVRVIWSSGYEDYEVYELDFFIDQFKCLNRK